MQNISKGCIKKQQKQMQSRNHKECLIVLMENYTVSTVILPKAKIQNGTIQKSQNHKRSLYSNEMASLLWTQMIDYKLVD